MEGGTVSALAFVRNRTLVTITAHNASRGWCARLMKGCADAGLGITPFGYHESGAIGTLKLAVPDGALDELLAITEESLDGAAPDVKLERGLAQLSAIGVGLQTDPSLAATVFEVFAANAVPLRALSVSDTRLACALDGRYLELVVRLLHDAFQLHVPPSRRRGRKRRYGRARSTVADQGSGGG